LHSAIDATLLLTAIALVWVDAIATKRGLVKGLGERNPALRFFIKKFGLAGLMVTRVLATALLLLLFAFLGQSGWLLFSISFISVMSYVILINARRTG
jgi:hypothetical protein